MEKQFEVGDLVICFEDDDNIRFEGVITELHHAEVYAIVAPNNPAEFIPGTDGLVVGFNDMVHK